MGVIVAVVDGIGDRNAGGIKHPGVHKVAGQPTKNKALVVQTLNVRPVQVLVVLHLCQCGFQGVGQVQHAKAAIAET
ncbi:hypothetical protein D3C76_1625610 [compost metagenome]